MLIRNWLQKLRKFHKFRSVVRTARAQRAPLAWLALGGEWLESRLLLSATPAGSEFLVNTTTQGSQHIPNGYPRSVAMDSSGDSVVTWLGQGGSGYGVYAQRFNSAGIPQGGEFRANTYTTGSLDS